MIPACRTTKYPGTRATPQRAKLRPNDTGSYGKVSRLVVISLYKDLPTGAEVELIPLAMHWPAASTARATDI